MEAKRSERKETRRGSKRDHEGGKKYRTEGEETTGKNKSTKHTTSFLLHFLNDTQDQCFLIWCPLLILTYKQNS